MISVSAAIEILQDGRLASVADAGAALLASLSDGQLDAAQFAANPLLLLEPPYRVSRYLMQVTLRALEDGYESTDDIAASLRSLQDRRPPVLEPSRRKSVESAGRPDRVVVPEARVLELRTGVEQSSIEALVTSGPLRNEEIRIRLQASVNPTACGLVSRLWVHAAIAAYNLAPTEDALAFDASPETFIVVEPLRQINATSVARSLRCAKPQIDQIRRGRGDVTVHTLKGIFVHTLFDRMLEGATDLDALYDSELPRILVSLAAVTDSSFNETAFRVEVLRHAGTLKRFIDANPGLRGHAQLELKRYSATLGIQGRIDALFERGMGGGEGAGEMRDREAGKSRDVPRFPGEESSEIGNLSPGNRGTSLDFPASLSLISPAPSPPPISPISLDILELKTGAQIRAEDHAQLFIYRLLVSDFIRRRERDGGAPTVITARLLSSTDGGFTPLVIQTDFLRVLDARNTVLAAHYALGAAQPHFTFGYEGFDKTLCRGCVSWTRKRCAQDSTSFGDRPGSEASPALTYFRRFSQLIERERWLADADVAELLDDSALDNRMRRFRTISGARITAGNEAFTFEFDANASDIEINDGVLVHCGNISSDQAFHGYVRDIAGNQIRVFIPVKNLTPATFSGRSWNIDRLPMDVTAEAAHSALYDFLESPDTAKKRAIVGEMGDKVGMANPDPLTQPSPKGEGFVPEIPLPEGEGGRRPGEGIRIVSPGNRGLPPISPSPISLPDSTLNSSQLEAVTRARGCDSLHLIWGPPGTGKTKVIPQIIAGVDGPILLGAFTNTAVDKMLLALLDHDPATRFLRMGRAADSRDLKARLVELQRDPVEYFSDDLAEHRRGVTLVREALNGARIVAATAHRACSLPYLRKRDFELAVVDEAGQLTEPLTLGLILRARRFVLIGDDRQLPPVVRTSGLALSMFERLKRERPGSVTLLDTQYRMHPDIMAVANRLFYGGQLRSGVSADERHPPDGGAVAWIPIESAAGEENERRNAAEAEAARDLALHYIRAHGIPGDQIGVVSPFRAQVALTRRLLEGAGVTVDTVERFQGGERDVMILSLVRSSASGFVFDERRFNVAITRARRKLVLLAHPKLFRNTRYEWLCSLEVHPL